MGLSHHRGSVRGRILNVTRAAGALVALILWSVGLFAVLPPAAMAALLVLTALAGLATLVAARRRSDRLVGSLILAVAMAFPLALFAIAEGEIVVTRRAASSHEPPDRLRLVDFNVLHGYPELVDLERRYHDLVSALEVLDPTVILLQEAWSVAGHGTLAERLGSDLGLDVAYARANGSRRLIGFEEGSAVLARLPIVSARRWVLAPRRPLWESRVALAVCLELAPGETLTVVTTHLTYRDDDVAGQQIRDLAARLRAGEVAVVAGDLNAASGSPVVAVFEEAGFAEALPGGIDHVLVHESSSWRVESAAWTLRPRDLAVLTGKAAEISDHPGIVVDLERATTPVAPERPPARGDG